MVVVANFLCLPFIVQHTTTHYSQSSIFYFLLHQAFRPAQHLWKISCHILNRLSTNHIRQKTLQSNFMPFWDNITLAYFKDLVLFDNCILDTNYQPLLIVRDKINSFWSELRSLPYTSNSRQSKITPALTITIYFGHNTQPRNSSSFLTSWKFIPQSKFALTTVYNSLTLIAPVRHLVSL